MDIELVVNSVMIPPGNLMVCQSLINVVDDNNYEMSETTSALAISGSSIPELVTDPAPSVSITIVDPEGNSLKGGYNFRLSLITDPVLSILMPLRNTVEPLLINQLSLHSGLPPHNSFMSKLLLPVRRTLTWMVLSS
jgi:hypothetical protein